MRSRPDAILQEPITRYLDALLPPADLLLTRMEKFASEHGHPIADRDVARLLEILTIGFRPKRIVEVGTNIGYSVVAMGRHLPADAVIESIEIDHDTLEDARRFIDEAHLECTIELHEGAALDILPGLAGGIDLAFIDCVKTEYLQYLELLIPRMRRGGMIVLDNLLWKGEVAGTERSAEAEALHEVNHFLMKDLRLTSVVVPMSDGIGLAVVDG